MYLFASMGPKKIFLELQLHYSSNNAIIYKLAQIFTCKERLEWFQFISNPTDLIFEIN